MLRYISLNQRGGVPTIRMTNIESSMEAKVNRILIYRLASMGDTVVALPCFNSIRRRHRTAQIALLTSYLKDVRATSAASLLGGTGLIDRYITYRSDTRNVQELRDIRREIRAFNPDVLIYLTDTRHSLLQTFRDYLFFRLCGVHSIIGLAFSSDRRKHRWLSEENGLWESEAHRLARCINTLGAVDVDDQDSWDLRLSDAELDAAFRALGSDVRQSSGLLGLAVGARQAAKDWGVKNWQAVLAGIANPNLGLVLIGAASDRDCSNEVAHGWPGKVINLCGETSPRVSAAVMKHLDLLLCHDGGPMHLAAAVGTPCIAVFSNISLPGVWFPFGSDHDVFYPASKTASIATIQPSQVIEAFQNHRALSTPPKRPFLRDAKCL
jgi:heptosyltransferase-3